MILTVTTLVIIVLLALYMSAQGVFSAVLLFAAALFGSVLAMGVYEPASSLLDKWPDFGRGLAFLIAFFLGFSAIRFFADYLLKENILLPKWVDKVGGGLIGALAGVVIVGTTMTGFEMLPLPDWVGQMSEIKNDEPLSNVDRLWPAEFVTGLYPLASGGAMGGTPIRASHPDLGAELTGYRHAVYLEDRTTIDPSLITTSNWYELSPERAKELGVVLSSSQLRAVGVKKEDPPPSLLVVRSTIDQGGEPPKSSYFVSDKGRVLAFSTTQVRLVTTNDHGVTSQYYPVGTLEYGRHFKDLPLGTGYTIDDYAEGKVVQDWVFAVDEGETPQFMEFKAGGRVAMAGRETKKPLPALALAAYPPHGWDAGTADLTVSVTMDGKIPAQGMAFRLNAFVKKEKIAGLLKQANEVLNGVTESRPTESMRIQLTNAAPDQDIQWIELAQIILQSKSETHLGVNPAWEYYSGPMKQALEDSGSLRETIDLVDGKGEGRVPTGSYVMLVIARKDTLLEAWIRMLDWDPTKATDANHKLSLHFDAQPDIVIDQKKL